MPQAPSRRLGIDFDMIVHPIHRLPPEILSIIFWHAIPRDKGFVVPSTRNAPLVLRSICKSWCSLSDRTPELWASIELFLFRPFTKALQAYNKWISKSSNSLLDLKIVVMATQRIQSSSKINSPLFDFIQCIKNHRHRWRNVVLSCPKFVVDLLLDGSISAVERLAISDSLRDVSDTSWDLGTLDLSRALKLWELKVVEPLRITPGNTTTAISCLHIGIGSHTQISSVLAACPLLEDLSMEFTYQSPRDFACGRYFFLPHLHTLNISFRESGLTSQHSILSAFRATALRRVTLERMKDSCLPHFINLLDQSDGRIEELTLTDVQIEEKNLLNCLTRVPLLSSLKIVDRAGLSDDFLKCLVWRSQSEENVCPRLSRLWLLRCSCSSMDSNIVLELIRSRSLKLSTLGPVAPLMELRFDGTQAQQMMLHCHPDIEACIKKGFELFRYWRA